jgi:hypothetical protein
MSLLLGMVVIIPLICGRPIAAQHHCTYPYIGSSLDYLQLYTLY